MEENVLALGCNLFVYSETFRYVQNTFHEFPQTGGLNRKYQDLQSFDRSRINFDIKTLEANKQFRQPCTANLMTK